MATANGKPLHNRKPVRPSAPDRIPSALETEWTAWMGDGEHPLGAPKHGAWVQALRSAVFFVYFMTSVLFIHFAQLLGAPLYFIDRAWFDAWMAMTKSYFGLFATTMTHWWSPTTIRVSGDKSMAGLIKQDAHGLLTMHLEPRAVLMANHQLYTDWLYLWWVTYTNDPPMHGHIYIILKESLKYAPILGPAMMFYGFIFMARKWSKDQQRLRYRLKKLTTPTHQFNSPQSTGKQLSPMWLLIFPEGTNISANTRSTSARYSAKSGIPDMKHQLLPRSTGLQFCLAELGSTVEYLYDCTIAYEGIPPSRYGQDIFTLRSVYFQGRPPKSVNMHWRRFPIASLPVSDHDAMAEWTLQRWREKDAMLETFHRTGRFEADAGAVEIEGAPREREWKTAYISTEVKTRHPAEFLWMFVPVTAVAVVGSLAVRGVDWVLGKK